MTPQVILYSGWYTLPLCRACPKAIFVFGDNLLGFGRGGQAIIRRASNSFGIPTKRKPAMSPGSFFAEGSEDDLDAVLHQIGILYKYLDNGSTLVVPVLENGDPSLGLERACLLEKAPTIYAAIQTHVKEWCSAYGSESVAKEEDLLRLYKRLFV